MSETFNFIGVARIFAAGVHLFLVVSVLTIEKYKIAHKPPKLNTAPSPAR